MKGRKIVLFLLGVVFILFLISLSFNNKENFVACTADAKLCLDGSAVGRDSNNNCEFFPCPELKQYFCDDESRNTDFCIEIYQPVCGWFDLEKTQCITFPCATTVSNSCFACQNKDILYWTEGECQSP